MPEQQRDHHASRAERASRTGAGASGSREASREQRPDTAEGSEAPAPRHRWWLGLMRYGLPAVVVIGGIVVMTFGDESQLEGGAGIVSAGLAIYFLNWVVRLGASGDRERDREQAAREYYTKHGRWPR
jgi:hypothetical protein